MEALNLPRFVRYLNQMAVCHDLPPLGARLVNRFGIERLMDGHLAGLGLWISRVRLAQQIGKDHEQPYLYTYNNPITYFDPSGDVPTANAAHRKRKQRPIDPGTNCWKAVYLDTHSHGGEGNYGIMQIDKNHYFACTSGTLPCNDAGQASAAIHMIGTYCKDQHNVFSAFISTGAQFEDRTDNSLPAILYLYS